RSRKRIYFTQLAPPLDFIMQQFENGSLDCITILAIPIIKAHLTLTLGPNPSWVENAPAARPSLASLVKHQRAVPLYSYVGNQLCRAGGPRDICRVGALLSPLAISVASANVACILPFG